MGGLNYTVTNLTSEAWDAAYARVEAYLRAMRIAHRPTLNQLVQEVLESSHKRIEAGDARTPAEVAGAELMEALVAWFRRVLQADPEESDTDVLQRGRLAVIMSDLPPGRQALILADNIEDEAFLAELRRAYQLTGPNFGRTVMTPQPLDFGVLPRAADSALKGLDRSPRIRLILLWLAALALFGSLFYFTR